MNGAPRLTVEDPQGPLRFTLAAGECVALLGNDASATATVMDRLAGHEAMPAGRILLDGCDITADPPSRRRLGLISARNPLFGHLSVRANVAFPLAVRGIREPERGHRVQQILALLGLDTQGDRLPATLSPTERVRAALARVLVSDPGLVLLEDPLRLLDPMARREMHHLLRRLARARDLTLLFVTGEREEALMMGERIGILDGFTLRQIAPATELLDRPADEMVATRFGEANSLIGQVEWVEDELVRVRLSAGPSMEAMASGPIEAGALCSICVRPERIAVAFAAGDGSAFGTDALSATLSDVVHLGDHLRLRFRLPGGGEVLVRRPAGQPMSGLRLGRPAQLAWQAVHAMAFAQDP